MPQSDVPLAIKALKALEFAVEVTQIEGRKGTFSIVGSEMKGVKGFMSKITGIIAQYGINIEQATQPYGENIIRFSVRDEDIPLAVAAVFSKALCIHGTSHEVYGNLLVETSKHPVAFVTIVGPLVAFKI